MRRGEPAGRDRLEGEGAMRKLIAVLAFVMPFLLAPPALAAVEINEVQPLNDFQVFIPCADQTVTLNGSLHVLLTFTINDRRLVGTDHFQPVRLTGVDAAGRTYRGVGITSDQFSASLQNGQFDTTFRNNFFIIGTAGAPSYKVHEVSHATIDARGRLVRLTDHLWITCR
jgi:hypothetical protein